MIRIKLIDSTVQSVLSFVDQIG